MTSQPVEANVVLTADNTQYDQAMMASAGSTNDLGKSIDTLGVKIGKLTKTAGKSLIGISAADVALITAATAAWGSYEKQMSRLQAQSAILSRTTSQQERLMTDYTESVKGLRKEYGTTTTEAARLVETLSKVTNIRQSRQLGDLSKVFTDMSKATGESSEGLASSLTNLQKIMGQPVNAKATRQYADMFTYLGAQTQGGTQSLIDFTAQMAPMGEAMGMNMKQVAGFATAFSKTGQEGFAAANVFNKAAGDITNAIQSGSPELKQYANIVGMTAEQFKKMDSGEQMVRIFEALNKQGDLATTTLQRLGLEGPRTQKAIAAIGNEPGGIRAALGMAEVGASSDSAAKGAKASMDNISHDFEEMTENLKRSAQELGAVFGPAIEKFTGIFAKMSENIADVMAGPLGEFLGMIMGIAAPLAGGTGAMLLFAGAILKVAAAFAVWRNSAMLGVREGVKGGAGIASLGGGQFGARGGGMLGERGAQIAERGTWVQRAMYNTGQAGGSALGGVMGTVRSGWEGGRGWADPNYTPARRGLLSYAAGGLGRTLDFVNPQFDQARYADPTRRTQWAGRFAPWTQDGRSARGRANIADTAARGVATETRNLGAIRAQEAEVRKNMVLTESGRAAQLESLKAQREETKGRLYAARETERVTRADIAARAENTAQVRNNTTGFQRLGKAAGGFAAGAGGAVGGVGRAAGSAIARSGMGWQVGGAMAMGGMAAMGVESNTLMMGAMGSMFGPGGAAVGLGAGLAIDMAKANDKVSDSVKNLNLEAKEASKSGQGLGQLTEMSKTAKGDIGDLNDSFKVTSKDYWFDMSAGLGSLKNEWEGWFGSSDIEELEKDQKKAQGSIESTEKAARGLAEAMGTELTGTKDNQYRQIDEFMSGEGATRLASAGIDFDELVKASKDTSAKGQKKYEDMLTEIATSGATEGVDDRLKAGGGIGAELVTSQVGKDSLQFQNDIPLFYKSVDHLFSTAVASGKSYLQIMKEAEVAQQEVGVENDRRHEELVAVSQEAASALALQAPGLGRVGAFKQQLDVGQMFMGITPETAEEAGQIKEQKELTKQAVGDQISYLRQMLLAQQQFDLSRQRAQDDYAEQRAYQEHDFYLGRERAEESFNRQRTRAVADYHRSVTRAYFDYNLGRKRAEEDFNHQVQQQAKQSAMSVYNIYERIQTQRTSSAEWILSNAQEQLVKMREQESNLNQLRRRGMSDTAIQQLDLTNPQNAQQLDRLVDEVTPTLIKQFNKTAGSARVKAAKDLVTDESSMGYQEMEYNFKKSMRRGHDDFERQMKLSRIDFKRGLRQQDEDFKISMDQQLEDYQTGVSRQEKAYKKSMDRQAEDFSNMANEILLSTEDVLTESQKRLTGAMGRQARQIASSIEDLKNSTKPEAVKLMTELAGIFGFDYTVPKGALAGVAKGAIKDAGLTASGALKGFNFHTGGTVPGWNPGRDTHTIAVGGGEGILRPEATRAIGGEKAIDALNHMAKHGAFASGGVFWPVPGHKTGTYAGHDGVDINRGSGSDDMGDPIRAFRAGKIVYVGSGRGYGDAIFEQTVAGTVVYGHTSAQAVHAGQMVRAGQLIGNVGSTGNSSAPHLHFGIPGGTTAQALALLAGAIVGGGGFGGMSGEVDEGAVRRLLSKKFPMSEAAAAGMKGVHPLAPGDISKVLRRAGRDVARRARRQMAGGDGPMDFGSQPNENLGNEAIVHTGASRIGWGDQWNALRTLVMHESSFNNTAQNPTSSAYGMFQFLDGTWGNYGGRKTSDPWKQTQYGLKYIKDRYGNPNKAWDFWQSHNWYGDGSVFTGPQTIGVGERGPEAVIPLNDRGGEFLTKAMLGAEARGVGMGSTPMRGGMSVYNTQIDRSTNFTGPITVQANDPGELLTKLQARQRVMALSRPSLTGSAA